MIGSQVREYRFLKLLGEGGMGSVYLVEHTLLNARRAVKLLHKNLTQHPSVVQRFLNEARGVAKLVGRDGQPHRNLIHVHELFQENGTWFMVMDYLEGATLSRTIERGPLPMFRVVHVVGGIANALKLAHANGIIHRDLKPDNVFVTVRDSDNMHIVLLDFGIAQLRNDLQAGPATKAGVLIGTPHFMAPEQLAGRAITTRTDIFALGVLGYMLATGGRHPWQYEDSAAFYSLREPELYMRMTMHAPIDPRRYVPTLTEQQAQALVAPLSPDPERRPASAPAYAIALAENTPTDGVNPDGLEVLRVRYPELLDTDDLSETVRSPHRPASMPASSSGLESKYQLGRKIGSGGMAEVYLGTTVGVEGFARPVAIKRIFTGLSESRNFAKMFIREANITAKLSHPNIVSVLDFSRDPQDRLILVMEYVDGKDLASILEAGPLSPSVAIFVATEILRGLGYAHGLPDQSGAGTQGVVHRDISPHNVLVSYEGEVKVCDFGLARALAASNASSSAVTGKPAYMSPEQVRSAPDLDGRADLFAVGIMLWEMLTGKQLFGGEGSFSETMARVIFQDIEPPSKARVGVPAVLDRIVLRLLARERADRYQRAEDALSDLFATGLAPTDGRGEVVATIAMRFPRSGGGLPISALAAPPRSATSSKPPTVPAQPIPAVALPALQTTLSAAASESGVASGSPKPGVSTSRLIALFAAVVLLGGGAAVFAIHRARERVVTAAQDASTRLASAGSSADAAVPRTSADAAILALAPDAPSVPTDAGTIVTTATPDAAVLARARDAGIAVAVADAGRPTGAAHVETTHPAMPHVMGELSVSCDPWCEIWIDGTRRASTVAKRFSLPAGPHVVKLVYPDNNASTTKKITISSSPTVIEQNW